MGNCGTKGDGRDDLVSNLFGAVSEDYPWGQYMPQSGSSVSASTKPRSKDKLIKIFDAQETTTGEEVSVRQIFCKPHLPSGAVKALVGDILALAHPNIQRVQAAYAPAGADCVFLVMERVPAESIPLSQYIATLTSLSFETARWIIHEIVTIVNYLHGETFAHGFLSLDSFMVVPSDEGSAAEGGAEKRSAAYTVPITHPRIVLVDFGLELKIGRNVDLFVALGAARFASPELAQAVTTLHVASNLASSEPKSDVFALGAILYFVLTGKFLVQQSKQTEALRQLRARNFGQDIQDGRLAARAPKNSKTLLASMLQRNMRDRPSLAAVLQHPFLRAEEGDNSIDAEGLCANFKQFAASVTMRKLLLATVTLRIEPENHARARSQFSSLDADKSGRIGLEEFVKAFGSQVASRVELEQMFKEIDLDGSGTIDYAEFLAAAQGIEDVSLEDRLVRAFEMWDKDGNGYIDSRDLKRVCGGLYTEEDINTIFVELERTGRDGKICYSEFMQIAQLPSTPSLNKSYNMKQTWTQIKEVDPLTLYEPVEGAPALGEGMTGKVYQIRSRSTGVLYAGKRVRIGKAGDSKASLMNEIQLLIDMDHPNIVRLHEVLESPRSLYLVMELCTGGELYDDLINRAQYTEVDAAKLFHQMCASIAYVHRRGIAHRDLKLENFIFQTKDKNSPLKLIDFGLSKKVQGRLARMVSVVGTAYYMAPEVVNRRSEYRVGKGAYYTKQCDMWSLGVLLYMMLSGVPPFDGDDDSEIRAAVKRGIYSEDDIAGCSDLAKDLIRRLLELDPEKRLKATEALKHPWFDVRFENEAEAKPLSLNIVRNIKNFHRMCRLKQTVMSLVAFEMSDVNIDELRKAFTKFDTDHSGSLSLEEFREAMKGKIADGDVDKLFEAIDFDKSGSIAYSEFISATIHTSHLPKKDKLASIFARLDVDGNGQLEAADLRRICRNAWTDEELDRMIKAADLNGDGKVDYPEFLSLMSDGSP